MTTRKILLLAWVLICGLLGFLTLQSKAFSDTPKPGAIPADIDVADFKDWRFACVADKGAKSCRIFQTVVWNRDKTHTANLTAVLFPVQADPNSKEKVKPVALMRLVLPLGANLLPGVAIVVGSKGKDQVKRPYHVCQPGGCFVDTYLAPEAIEKLKGADAMLVAFAPIGEKSTTLKISLNGFPKAYEALDKTAVVKSRGYERN